MIDKHSSVPIYLQIEQILTDQIDKGILKPGESIPSEPSMCEQFGVSRMTARKAVDYLVRQGVVERIRGKGTFVCEHEKQLKIALPLDKHLTSSEVADFLNSPITNQLLHLSKQPVAPEIAGILGVKAGEEVWYMKRLRLVGNTPFVFERTYMLAQPFSDLTEDDLNKSKYGYLAERGYAVGGSKKEIRAELPMQDVRELLGLRRDEPVLFARSVAFLDDKTPFEVSDIYYNQEHYTFTLDADR